MKDKYPFEKNSAKFAYRGALTLQDYCPPKGSHKKFINLLLLMHINPEKKKLFPCQKRSVFYSKTKED